MRLRKRAHCLLVVGCAAVVVGSRVEDVKPESATVEEIAKEGPTERRLIFISHATPDNNEITRWLCGRLTALGYRVWADLSQLRGGDRFWADIQNAIRNESVRFLAVTSRISIARNGVLDELAEARDVGAKLKDSNFIIPIRADDLPWSDFPIQLKQLNGIDFSKDWAAGLKALLDALESDSVPRDRGDPEVSKVARRLVAAREHVSLRSESGLMNWLAIRSLPRNIHYYLTSMSANALATSRPRIRVPCVAHDRLAISFAEVDAMNSAVPDDIEVEPRHTITLEEFLEGTAKQGPSVDGIQAHNYLSEILRQAFENVLSTKGMVQFDRRWFVPTGWREKNQGWYLGPEGKEQYRVLVGKAKESVWHFAIAPTIRARAPQRVHVVPHVLFSPDGVAPYLDQKQLRRRHCKLWWNDKWRDLLLALLAEIFGRDRDVADISLGGNATMQLSASPLQVRIPASYSEEGAHIPQEDEEEAAEWDEEDDEEQLE